MSADRVRHNPFLVLGVPRSATRMEVERAGQKLLAELSIGVAYSGTYRTPFGLGVRDESAVRAALATLRNPEERLLAEIWAADPGDAGVPELPTPWEEAFHSIGWRGPCTD